MATTKWDPFRNADASDEGVDRMFEELFPGVRMRAGSPACAWTPAADIYHNADGVAISIDLPGVAREDISVEVGDNVLTISGRRRLAPGEETNCFRRERCFGTFRRAFAMKFDVSLDKVAASLKHGVLTVRIPLPENEATRRIRVDVD